MFSNYLKIAWRTIIRNRIFSAINIAGMTLGISVCFFALLFVNFELSYDTHHQKADRIYRLVTDVQTATGVDYMSTMGAMAPAIQAAFPEVEATTRIFLDYLILQKDRDQPSEEKIAYADSSLFSVFTIPLIRGNPKTALTAPYTVVLSETAARRFFGSADPMGKTLVVNGRDLAHVTGVMNDMPYQSHIRVDILMSMATLGNEWQSNWKRFFFYTYLLLPTNCNTTQLSSKITKLVSEHTDQRQSRYTLSLEPLTSVYLHGKPRGSRSGSSVSGSLTNVYIFSVVAAFVLFIAGFNFINLTTAFAAKRVREIGVRKVLGAERKQLISQFLIEAILLNLLAFIVAVILCMVALPLFNTIAGKVISQTIFQHNYYLGWLFIISILIGLISGIYPAFFLSGFQPVNSLRGRFLSSFQAVNLRGFLVVTQFAISVTLIIATMVVYTQLHHMQNHELGFQKGHKLVVDFQFDDRIIGHSAFIKQQLAHVPGIEGVSMSSGIPGRANHQFPTKLENHSHELQAIESNAYFIDHDFLQQYQIDIIAGRALSPQFASDSTDAILINEAAVKSLGYANPQDALGKRFEQLNRKGLIIGVVRNFHFRSLQETVQPLTLRMAPGFFTFVTLTISAQHTQETISSLRKEWQKVSAGTPFVYFFADEAYDAQYRAEERFGKLFMCLSAIAILISCLGLLGLSIFSTVQRTKEIGVRKVLGASIPSIVALLSKDFLKLVLIAIVIASPLAWWAMNKWLGTFAYKIDIQWWVFALAGTLAVGIALLTVSFQSIRAALMNPVKSLRSE